MTLKLDTSPAESTETSLTVHIITRSSSGMILKIRNSIPGQKTEKTYIRLTHSTTYGDTDTQLLEMFLSSLRRMLRDTNSRKSLVSELTRIMVREKKSSP